MLVGALELLESPSGSVSQTFWESLTRCKSMDGRRKGSHAIPRVALLLGVIAALIILQSKGCPPGGVGSLAYASAVLLKPQKLELKWPWPTFCFWSHNLGDCIAAFSFSPWRVRTRGFLAGASQLPSWEPLPSGLPYKIHYSINLKKH